MKKLISCISLGLAALSLAACGGGTVVQQFDPNKTTIKVNVFNGGMGTEWMTDLIAQFNAANTEFEIVALPKKMTATEIVEDLQDGDPYADVYFGTGVNYQVGIYRDFFEDLSDLLEVEPDGAGTGKIKDKMVDYDAWMKMASKYGQGMYVFPNADTVYGMVFDYKLFVENGWLSYATTADEAAITAQGITYTKQGAILKFQSSTSAVNYKAGDILLTAGKDGKFGTYDDGQPTTIAEFDEMLNTIAYGDKQAKTFLYTPAYSNYLNDMQSALYAQYIGAENFELLFDFDSEGKEVAMHDGSQKVITVNNGYDIYKSEAVYQSLAFIKKYMTASTVDPSTKLESSYSHTDAQNDYLLGYKKETGFSAILCEGNWWENEAKTMFDNIAKEDASRAYGQREYRMFVYPTMEGQATAANKSVIGAGDVQGVVVAKQKDAKKLEKIKEFLVLSAKEANLKKFTQYTGCTKLFEYDLTEAEKSALTPFARNCWEMRADTEHVSVVRGKLYQAQNPFIFTSNFTYNTYVPVKRGTTYTLYIDRFMRDLDESGSTLEDLYTTKAGLLGYSAAEWVEFINTAKTQGFYTNL